MNTKEINSFILGVLSCVGVLLPLAFLGLRHNYKFALQQVARPSETRELTKQYRVLLFCLLIGVIMVVSNTAPIGLLIAILLIYLAVQVIQHRVTVLAAHWRGKPICVGKVTIWAIPVYIGGAIILIIWALAAMFGRSYP